MSFLLFKIFTFFPFFVVKLTFPATIVGWISRATRTRRSVTIAASFSTVAYKGAMTGVTCVDFVARVLGNADDVAFRFSDAHVLTTSLR